MQKKFLKYVLAASIVTSPIITPTKSFNGEDVGYAAFGGLVIGTIISWASTYLYLNKRCEKKMTENDKKHQATLDEFNARIDKLKKKLAAKKEENNTRTQKITPDNKMHNLQFYHKIQPI